MSRVYSVLHHMNKRKNKIISIFITGALLLLMVFVPQQPVNAATSSYTMTVSDNTVSDFRVGFGWNTDYQNADLYSAFDDTAWNNYFNIYKWSGVDWTRKEFIGGGGFEPTNDNSDPNSFNWGAFVFDTSGGYSYYPTWLDKSLQFDKDNGIDVLAVNWDNRINWNGGSWSNSGNAPTSKPEFAENIAAAMKIYCIDKGFNNIKWLSIWNEPNWHYNNASFPQDFATLYGYVTNRLQAVGLSGIGYAGPGSTCPDVVGQQGTFTGLPYMLDNLGTGIYSMITDHDYANLAVVDGATTDMTNYSNSMNMVHSKIGTSHPPMVVSEMGTHYPAVGDDVNKIYDGQLDDAETICRTSQLGYEGYNFWAFLISTTMGEDRGDALCYAPLKQADGYVFEPNSCVLYPKAVISKYARKGWQVKQITNESGGMNGSNKKLTATAFKSGSNKSIMVVNDSSIPVLVTVNISSGYGAPDAFNWVYTSSATSGIVNGGTAGVSNGQFNVTVPGRSINTFTTLSTSDINAPESWKWSSGGGNGYIKLQNHGSSKVLDDGGTTNGAPAYIYDDISNDVWQEWKYIDQGNGYFKLQNHGSGKVLDDSGTTNGATAYVYDIVSSIWQEWRKIDVGNGYFKLQNHGSGKVLDDGGTTNGTYAYVYDDVSNNVWQEWKDISVSGSTPTPVPSGNNYLNSGQSLTGGNSLWSPDHTKELVMQTDGNLAIYQGGTVLWAAGTGGRGNSHLDMQNDGNLVTYLNSGGYTWSTNRNYGSGYCTIENDGHLKVYSGTYGSGTLRWTSTTGSLTGEGN